MEFVPGARVRVCAGPFAGHDVEVIEPLGNNLIRVVVMLLDGPARLELSLLDLDPDAGGAGGAGVREPRRPLLPHGSASVPLPLPPEAGLAAWIILFLAMAPAVIGGLGLLYLPSLMLVTLGAALRSGSRLQAL